MSARSQASKFFIVTVWGFLLSVFSSPAVFSQAPFYQGKTITIIRGSAPGGVGEMRTRAVANYLKKHVPGNPTVVIEFMAGAGGTKAANHVFKNVRPDGLTMGRVGGGLVANAVLGEKGVLYDLNKFIYLGSPHSTYHWVFITRKEAGLKTIEALRSANGISLLKSVLSSSSLAKNVRRPLMA